jgi:hypothetical protein
MRHGRKHAMKKSMINQKLLTVMLGFLFIGGGAALLGVYHLARNAELPLGYLMEENDGEIFVYGAHA